MPSDHFVEDLRHVSGSEGAQRLSSDVASCGGAQRESRRRLRRREHRRPRQRRRGQSSKTSLDRDAGVLRHCFEFVGAADRVFGLVNAFVVKFARTTYNAMRASIVMVLPVLSDAKPISLARCMIIAADHANAHCRAASPEWRIPRPSMSLPSIRPVFGHLPLARFTSLHFARRSARRA